MVANAKSLRVKQLQGDFEEVTEADTAAEVIEALPLTLTDAENNPDFTYNATTEDNLNQTAEADYTGVVDGQAGITYNGPAGMYNHLRVSVANLDILEGAGIAPAAGDSVVPVLLVNSNVIAFFDTEDARAPSGGFVSEIDTEIAAEYHIDTIVQVQNGDVIRVGLQGGGENTVDWDIAEGGEFLIS